jgi:hypothetical protein
VFDVCEGLQGVYWSESKIRGKGDGAAEKVAVFQMRERIEGAGELLGDRKNMVEPTDIKKFHTIYLKWLIGKKEDVKTIIRSDTNIEKWFQGKWPLPFPTLNMDMRFLVANVTIILMKIG